MAMKIMGGGSNLSIYVKFVMSVKSEIIKRGAVQVFKHSTHRCFCHLERMGRYLLTKPVNNGRVDAVTMICWSPKNGKTV